MGFRFILFPILVFVIFEGTGHWSHLPVQWFFLCANWVTHTHKDTKTKSISNCTEFHLLLLHIVCGFWPKPQKVLNFLLVLSLSLLLFFKDNLKRPQSGVLRLKKEPHFGAGGSHWAQNTDGFSKVNLNHNHSRLQHRVSWDHGLMSPWLLLSDFLYKLEIILLLWHPNSSVALQQLKKAVCNSFLLPSDEWRWFLKMCGFTVMFPEFKQD